MSNQHKPIIVALDFPDATKAMQIVDQLDPSQCRMKIGKELFTAEGPDFVRRVIDKGYDVFLDLKFHDIPTTVGRACLAATRLGVWMLNVHASGGEKMLSAALEAVKSENADALLIAVTILTSHGDDDLRAMGFHETSQEAVMRLATLASRCGLDGVVCSAREAIPLRNALPAEFNLVTPGIRPVSAEADDQQRVMTPGAAIAAGVDYLVVGRPITQAESPAQALENILSEIRDVKSG